MTADLSRVLVDVFDRQAERRLSVVEEQAAIRAAAEGDSEALVALVYAYAAALRSVARSYRAAIENGAADPDDVRQAAVVGLLDAVRAFDPAKGDRLAGLVVQKIREALHGEQITGGFSIPDRTLTRFAGLLRKADGDPTEAARIAPDHGMSRETFWAVFSVVRGTESLDAETSPRESAAPRGERRDAVILGAAWEPDYANSADEDYVDLAFESIRHNDLATDVVRLAYGFTDYEPQSDGEVADRLGLTRSKTQRVRSRALDTMRDALAVVA